MQKSYQVIYFSSILALLTACNNSELQNSTDQVVFSLPNISVTPLQRSSNPLAATTNTASTTVTEANTTNYFQLSLSAAMSTDASVSYKTKNGTAIAGSDYSAEYSINSGTATISAGETSILIGIDIFEDSISELTESFSLVISNPVGGIFPSGTTEITATHTILDNDASSSSPIDITDSIFTNTSSSCADYVNSYQSSVSDVKRNQSFQGSLSISLSGNKCNFTSNAIPNHNFQDGSASFATNVSEQNQSFSVTTSPVAASSSTELSLNIDNGIFLNGAKLDLLAAACYNVGDEKIGCFDMNTPWRFDPMSPLNDFGTDSHNAHTQPEGTYHYHGSPVAMFYNDTAVISPVIGFAADGFPIYGSYFDDNGTTRKATSSYQLKQGARVAISGENPGDSYDGKYVDDYEYKSGAGDLDECNGMTVNGSYGYYVTDSYPWVMKCFTGTPDSSFSKQP